MDIGPQETTEARAADVRGPSLYGTDLFGNPVETPGRGKISDEFLLPPFTVLNAREGWWQERKRAWIALGIQSELGRGENSLSLSRQCEQYRTGTDQYADRGGLVMGTTIHPFDGVEGGEASVKGTSIFDPVLCELAYRWFCPKGGMVIDPFAGGSVRGIVASVLGYQYWGCDLRAEQIEANEAQAAAICEGVKPQWVVGDSVEMVASAPAADFVFSCPPYMDLERYSDNPRDLSTMADFDFLHAYGKIIAGAVNKLKEDRFACFVVGEVRAQSGFYRNFVSDTIAAFEKAGARFYNEAILVTQVGSLPIRINSQWRASRKMGKTHQNVLVFVKGNPRKATALIEVAA
ncbi:MAG: hypothetical protein IT170_06540 [Bryobacterales bacterium]|nr:hypothetical protein [Bryobacterales bacterium]